MKKKGPSKNNDSNNNNNNNNKKNKKINKNAKGLLEPAHSCYGLSLY